MRLYRHPSRNSVHPAVQVLLSLVSVWGWMIGTVSLICLYGWAFSIASSDSQQQARLFMPHTVFQQHAPYLSVAVDCDFDDEKKEASSSSSSSSSSLSAAVPLLPLPLVPNRDAYTVCSEAQTRVESGEWVDPNDRRIYARQVETFPQFYISLHNESFDPVRWRIMTEGKYYEEYVYNRFLQILSSNFTNGNDRTGPKRTTTTSTTGKRSVILDVGANIGYYTLLSAALGHSVVSFEPNPANLLRLCESIRLNGWMQAPNSGAATATPQLFLLQQAVGDEHGAELMLYTPRNPGMGYLREIGQRGTDTNTTMHQAKTRMIRLDDFAHEQGWFDRQDDNDDDALNIDILKIDVEGKEPQVVLGAQKLLASGLVRHVLTEGRRFGRKHVPQSLIALFDTGFQLRDPVIPSLDRLGSSTEKAKAIQDYYRDKLGPNSRVVTDLWWTKI